MNWKVGDLCLHEHEICRVEEVQPDGSVTCLTTGYINSSYRDFRDSMFPLTLEGKCCADYYQSEYLRLHRDGGIGLNFPDIANKVASLFETEMAVLHDPKKREKANSESREWFRKTWDAISERNSVTVGGTKLFERR